MFVFRGGGWCIRLGNMFRQHCTSSARERKSAANSMLKSQVFSGKLNIAGWNIPICNRKYISKGPFFSLLCQQCRRGKQNHSGGKCFKSPIGKTKYSTLQGTNLSHLRQRKIIFKSVLGRGYVSCQEGRFEGFKKS